MKKEILSLLKQLEKSSKTFWNIAPEAGQFLNSLVKDRQYKKVLEIGTSNGYSGIWLAEALSQTKGQLYTMESHKERFKLASENFEKAGLKKHITQIAGHAPEDFPATPPIFDMAFFDATKDEHLAQFQILKSRIKKGGLIATDNIHSHKEELKDYLKIVKATPGWRSTELNLGTGLLISFKE